MEERTVVVQKKKKKNVDKPKKERNRRRNRRRNKSKSARFESVRILFLVQILHIIVTSYRSFFAEEERLDNEKQEESVTSYKITILA